KKKDGVWWVFVRHAGQRISEQVGSEEDAIEAKKEIEQDIRRGKYDIAAVKAARASAPTPKEEKPAVATLKEYFEKTVRPLWEGSLSHNAYLSYDGSFRVHILPVLGDLPL